MPTEDTTSTDTTTETVDQVPAGQQAPTGETPGNGEQQPSTPTEPVKLPDDHPLVKTLTANKDKISSLTTELREARAQSAKATQLEEELGKRPTTEVLETLQTRYDRLEAFLQAAGGPLGKALDSRTFTKDLFETDKEIADIVKDWNKANPTATSTALGAAGAEPAKGKPNPNDLLRAAAR